MSDLKVALISHEFPPFAIGGIANHCYDLAWNLARRQIKTKVICGTTRKIEEHRRVNRFLEVIRLPFLNYPPRYFWFQLINHRKLCKLIADCNILHGVNPTASLFSAYHEKKSGKALITTHHLNELQTLKMYVQMPLSELTFGDLMINALSYPLDDFIERKWFKYADQIIIPGYATYEFMKKVYPSEYMDKVSVIYNGINFDKIQALRCNAQSLEESDLSIVSFSRLVSLKGIGQLLSGIKKLFSDFPSAHLKIFGDGPLRPILVKTIRREKLERNVSIMGYVAYAELLSEVSRASFAVFPTFLEVGPFISALEAMACKKPIVVFDLPFNREFVQHMKTGVMAKAGDMNDFIDKMAFLLSNEDLRKEIGEAAYTYVRKNHNWKYLVNNYIKIYEENVNS